ncbi:MAG: PKD domain-containing protein, partial [Bacteroidaceae bacterium]|nr:PKD domain-containing protein [Bacteroidaceae bacterium]
IKYKSGDEDLAHINSNGTIVTTGRKLGSTTVRAWFEGNDTYLADTIQYVLNVVAKPVIPAPTVDVVGGTYTSAQTVTITSNSPLCKAIWYSTTAADSVSMTDEPVIVAGNVAVVTIDKSCTLRCCAVDYNNIGNVLTQEYVMNIPLKADFTADETSTVYYTMNWDSPEEASTWSYFAMDDEKHTWTLMSSVPLENVAPFTQFDANNVYSLGIYYDSKNPQRERAVSPEITVRPNSEVSFYTAFCSVWLYSEDLYLRVYDMTTMKVDTLFSAFQWAQKEGFTGPNWVGFNLPLDKYAGHNCKFEFLLAGQDGDNFCVDGFKLIQKDESEDAKVSINQGDEVHFADHSEGTPESWQWTFDGPSVITSDEQNPTVQFIAPGTYNVTLVVKKEGDENRYVKTGFVTVNVQSPLAHIDDVDCGYQSPWCMAFIPVGASVTYNDASSCYPTSWNWTFEGANPGTSTEQSPTVTYNEAGLYGMQLDVANSAGSDKDFLLKAIKVGGSTDIWNISPAETDQLTEVGLGFYGYYGGSNYLGIRSYAEHFAKPLAAAYVDSVSVYFANVTAANSDAEITVSICPAVNGLPGEPLASKSLKISELAYDDNYVVPTYFDFGKQVSIDSEFFVTISGFPNEDGDHVSVLSVYRGEAPAYSSTYHEMEDQDPNNSYAGLGTYTWYKNDDEGVSLALTAHLTYVGNATGIETASAIEAEVASSAVYDLKGVRMNAGHNSLRKSGVYVVREGSKVRKVLVK